MADLVNNFLSLISDHQSLYGQPVVPDADHFVFVFMRFLFTGRILEAKLLEKMGESREHASSNRELMCGRRKTTKRRNGTY